MINESNLWKLPNVCRIQSNHACLECLKFPETKMCVWKSHLKLDLFMGTHVFFLTGWFALCKKAPFYLISTSSLLESQLQYGDLHLLKYIETTLKPTACAMFEPCSLTYGYNAVHLAFKKKAGHAQLPHFPFRPLLPKRYATTWVSWGSWHVPPATKKIRGQVTVCVWILLGIRLLTCFQCLGNSKHQIPPPKTFPHTLLKFHIIVQWVASSKSPYLVSIWDFQICPQQIL